MLLPNVQKYKRERGHHCNWQETRDKEANKGLRIDKGVFKAHKL